MQREHHMIIGQDIEYIKESVAIAQAAKSRSALHADKHAGLWPFPVAIGGRSVAYLKHEVQAVLRARAAGKGDEEIRALVAELRSQRVALA